MKWTQRRVAAVRAALELHGLRVLCLLCRWEGRHFGGSPRLRDRPCPRCKVRALRSYAWVARFPELARAKRDELARTRYALGE